ncbi:MAG: hypothetical protein K5773_02795 [Pseudobutyrivibrio sp.]|nr:hypothetical protein [Pseudobutyrivibrio sp.]
MKLKYYLRGAGIGIIIATLIFSISSFYKDSYSKATHSLSNEEIIERAEKLGMVMAEDGGGSDDSAEESSLKADENAVDEAAEDIASDTKEIVSGVDKATAQVDEVVSKEEEKLDKEEEAADKKQEEIDDSSVTYVPFTVHAGDSSNVVALNLQKAGLVDDSDKFNDYLNKIGVDDRIQGGTFYVKENSTYDDLAALLVTKQDQRQTSPQPTPNIPKNGEDN